MRLAISISHTLLAFFLLVAGCSSSQIKEISSKTDTTINPAKVLIVYLSRTNNTKAVAEIIQRSIGGTLTALELEKPYPENYQAIVQQVVQENETGYLPALKTKFDSIQKYDVVFVGFPTWGMQLPPPIASFLKRYDMRGKTIVPFNTNAGYGVGSSFETVKGLCPNSKVLEGYSTKGGVERDGVYFVIKGEKAKEVETDVRNWLQKIRLINFKF